MTRNTVKRVEVAIPICQENIKERVQGIFSLMLSDNKNAREEDGEGIYHKIKKNEGELERDTQEILYRQAYERSGKLIP